MLGAVEMLLQRERRPGVYADSRLCAAATTPVHGVTALTRPKLSLRGDQVRADGPKGPSTNNLHSRI
jgi:hypothetical protein